MGALFFGAQRTAIAIDDQTLSTLLVVIAAKLRRNESFMISWRDSVEIGDGRSAIWINVSSELHFKFSGSKPTEIDRDAVAKMMEASVRSTGIELAKASLTKPVLLK